MQASTLDAALTAACGRAIMELVSLANDLDDWTDWDGAAYALGRTLGLFQDADFLGVKHIFWADTRLGDGLHDALIALVSAGVLARREEPDEQFRWLHQ